MSHKRIMKESVLDVLMYLFDQYIEEEVNVTPDQESLRVQLKEAGFPDQQVNRAFDWLEGLAIDREDDSEDAFKNTASMRVYTDIEMQKLGVECRGLILFLEQARILDPYDREFVIERVMALDTDEIELQQLKWVVLMVLLNQPGKEAAYAWMEDIMMDDVESNIH